MTIRSRENLIGAWAFLSGVVLALLVGVLSSLFGTKISPVILGVLALLGVVVGFSVSERNAQTFLLASVSLVLVSFAGVQGFVLSAAISGISIGMMISYILSALLALFVPATIIVAIKTIFAISQ